MRKRPDERGAGWRDNARESSGPGPLPPYMGMGTGRPPEHGKQQAVESQTPAKWPPVQATSGAKEPGECPPALALSRWLTADPGRPGRPWPGHHGPAVGKDAYWFLRREPFPALYPLIQ